MSVSPLAIVVMGVSGSGKSTTAQRLAARFDCPFIEGDDLHSPENVASMRAGIALTDEDRWPWLATIGTLAGNAARAGGCVVVACSALKKSYRERIRNCAACTTLFVLLDVEASELERRLAERIGHYMPTSLLQSQLSLLEKPEPGEIAMSFTADGDHAALMEDIAAWLQSARISASNATAPWPAG